MVVRDLHGLIKYDGFPKVADDGSTLVVHQEVVQLQIPVHHLRHVGGNPYITSLVMFYQ